MFQVLGERYDSLGALLSAAALAGGLGGMVLGRFIDLGHARSVVLINASILAGTLIFKSLCGHSLQGAIAVAIIATMLSGFYIPCWMTAVYNEAKAAPCTFRFHFVAEGGWDIGGATAGLVASALCVFAFPIEAAILLALPAVAGQALLLRKSYRREPLVMVSAPSYR